MNLQPSKETVMRTWQDNAAEFGALTKQGVDVRLAVLVACSVENSGKGRPKLGERPIKTTAAEFAQVSATTHKRILRHLDAWNKAAADGLCIPSVDLTPADATDPDLVVPTDSDFRSRQVTRRARSGHRRNRRNVRCRGRTTRGTCAMSYAVRSA